MNRQCVTSSQMRIKQKSSRLRTMARPITSSISLPMMMQLRHWRVSQQSISRGTLGHLKPVKCANRTSNGTTIAGPSRSSEMAKGHRELGHGKVATDQRLAPVPAVDTKVIVMPVIARVVEEEAVFKPVDEAEATTSEEVEVEGVQAVAVVEVKMDRHPQQQVPIQNQPRLQHQRRQRLLVKKLDLLPFNIISSKVHGFRRSNLLHGHSVLLQWLVSVSSQFLTYEV